MILEKNKTNLVLLFFLLLFGSYIAYDRGSNFSDGDSYSVILSFLNLIETGIYTPSRGAYGHPIPELIIGFFSYNFGTPISNLICFIFFFCSIILIFNTFFKKKDNQFLFILLILSNSYLFLENTNSIDYPIALFFFSFGLFFLKKKKLYLSYIFFALTIASRANFLTFVYPILIIYFFNEIKNYRFKKVFFSFLIVSLIGIIFYIPLLNLHNYSLSFIDIPFITTSDSKSGWYGGPSLEINSLLPRFVYKIYNITGIFSFFIIFLFILKKVKKFKLTKVNNQICLAVIFVNLLVFFFMPTKILIINPFIIFFYVLLFKYLDTFKILLIITFNFLQWVVAYNVADIKYRNQEICYAKEAVSYDFKLTINQGKFVEYLFNNKDMTICYSKYMGEYEEPFKKGLPLKRKLNIN